MSKVTSNPEADLNAPLAMCEVLHRPGVPCANPIARVAVCTNAPGYLPMCSMHASHFEVEYPKATVRWLTPDAFDSERAGGLYMQEA